jgi:hypothetical protein
MKIKHLSGSLVGLSETVAKNFFKDAFKSYPELFEYIDSALITIRDDEVCAVFQHEINLDDDYFNYEGGKLQ